MRNPWAKPLLLGSIIAGAVCLWSGEAEAQYKNGQIGFEGGYFFLGSESGLDQHAFLVALRGAYKISDHWWFTARAGVSFRGEQVNEEKTVVLFHLTPIDARYYFATDRLRPFVGLTNSFQFLFNNSTDQSVWWGPGAVVGAEFLIRRDLFIGVQADASWMFVFEGADVPMMTTTVQLLFFL
jgi:hypothetical protein